jgi:hypothetical protein
MTTMNVGLTRTPERREGSPIRDVLDNPHLRFLTGRMQPDIWETENSSPRQREEVAYSLQLDNEEAEET